MALEDVAVYTRGRSLTGNPLNRQESLHTLAVTRVKNGVSEAFAGLTGKTLCDSSSKYSCK